MRKLSPVVFAAAMALGAGSVSAADPTGDQKAPPQQQKTRAAEMRTDLHREIASPVHGEFSMGAQFSRGMGVRPDVGGFSGNGFLGSSGLPSSTPGNPGTYF